MALENGKRYHPMEVCKVEDCQRVELRKQTAEQMQIMIKQSARKPTHLQAHLAEMALRTGVLANANLAAMEISVESGTRVAKGRLIPAPAIRYATGAPVRANADNGDWRMPDRAKFVTPGVAEAWTAVALVPPADAKALQQFVHNLTDYAIAKGLKLGLCQMTCFDPARLEAEFKTADVAFFLFIISDAKEDTSVKDRVKMLEHRYGIPTQCVTEAKAIAIGRKERGSSQVLENIVNKTNMKLGGVNYHLDSKLGAASRWLAGDGKVMLLGADVNHPPPQPRSLRHLPPREPSVVGFVGNSPRDPHLFTGEISFQNPREELIQDMPTLAGIFAGRWMGQTGGALPEEVIFFRDGVSHGSLPLPLPSPMRDRRSPQASTSTC